MNHKNPWVAGSERSDGPAGRGVSIVWLALCAILGVSSTLQAQDPPAKAGPARPKIIREIFVPYEDLSVLLEGQPRRVFLGRQEFDELRAKVKKDEETKAPVPVSWLTGSYEVALEPERARITGKLEFEVLSEGWQEVPLALAGVGVRKATLDDQPAPLGQPGDGRTLIFVNGQGMHTLTLELVAPLATTAAQQQLSITLPVEGAAKMTLSVPGNVEIRSGGQVLSRTVDEAMNITRFELVPTREPLSLTMSLNNKRLAAQRFVLASSVLLDEVTASYEMLHATVSLAVLQGATDTFRFELPAGFEVTEVKSDRIDQWSLDNAQMPAILTVKLREPATDRVELQLTALRPGERLAAWTFPRLTPLDVGGSVALLGVLAEDRLKLEEMKPSDNLVPLDFARLEGMLPPSVENAPKGAPTIKAVAAFFAPRPQFDIAAKFSLPPGSLAVQATYVWTLNDREQAVLGSLTLTPEVDKLVMADLLAPAGWEVNDISDAAGQPLVVDRFTATRDGQPVTRLRIRLKDAVLPGQSVVVNFRATRTPPGWLGNWTQIKTEMPIFSVAKAGKEFGFLAIGAIDDLELRPTKTTGLLPLMREEIERLHSAGKIASLAYRYDLPPYALELTVERPAPVVTARVFDFFELRPGELIARYELVYEVQQARTQKLSFRLPASAPTSVNIVGLVGSDSPNIPQPAVKVQETVSELTPEGRVWTVTLAERRGGRIRLGVDFRQQAANTGGSVALPLAVAEDVSYQTSLAAVEGHPDIDVTIPTGLESVDIGVLTDALYQPGRRLIGVYSFLGSAPQLAVKVGPRAGYPLATTLVERAELVTRVAGGQASITSADFRLKTKAALIEAELPAGAVLWTVLVDGQPTKPQLDPKKVLLIELPPSTAAMSHTLRLVYELPGRGLGFWGDVQVAAPLLFERAERAGAREEIPLADVAWQLVLPSGYRVVRTQGSVSGARIERTQPVLKLAGTLYGLGGGFRERHAVDLSGGYYMSDDVAAAKSEAYPYPRTRGPRDFLAGNEGRYQEAEELASSQQATPPQPTVDPAASQPTPDAKPEDVPPPREPAPAPAPAPANPFGAPASPLPQPPVAATVNPPPPPPQTPALQPPPARVKLATLQGVRSLPMELQPVEGEQVLLLRGLGTGPTLEVTLADDLRFRFFGCGLAAVIVICGLWLTRASLAARLRLIAAALLVSTLVPLVTGYFQEWDPVFESVFLAGCLVAAWYLLVALYDWVVEIFRNPPVSASPPVANAPGSNPPVANAQGSAPPAAVATAIFLAMLLGGSSSAWAQDLGGVEEMPVPEVAAPELPPAVEVGPPPKIPEDALLIPYDGQAADGVAKADRVMVPYAEYIRLWNLAFPSAPKETPPPGRGYAFAAANYKATLAEGDEIELAGELIVDLFGDKPTDVPLSLAGAVLSRISVDGQPAKIRWALPAPPPGAAENAPQQQAMPGKGTPSPMPLLMVTLSGKGRKKIELVLRARLQRQGGWRILDAQLPHGPATSLTLALPQPGTEVRLSDTPDRGNFTAPAANATFETVLAANGRLRMQWRGQVTEAMVDRSLSVNAAGVFDVREDGLRLVWELILEFPRAQRESFTLQLPAGYDLERVAGVNVRGWEKKEGNLLDVTLLKAARDSEKLTIFLARRPPDVWKEYAEFPVPSVSVTGAVIQRGIVTIRRSRLISLRVTNMTAMSRADVPEAAAQLVDATGIQETWVNIVPFQAYRFDALPFTLSLAATRIADQPAAQFRTLVRLTRREARAEAAITVTPRDRPLHSFRVRVPDNFEVEQVVVPEIENQWHLATEDGKRVLVVRLAKGITSETRWVLRGLFQKAADAADLMEVALPVLELLDAERQEGDLAVIADPGLDIAPADLKGLEATDLARTYGWLGDANISLARLALHYSQPGYSGRLLLTARKPRVSALSISNVRVTDRVIEETIFLEFTVREAGIREVAFEVPARFRTARIVSPPLRQKTIEDAAGGWVRFKLEFQTEVIQRGADDRLVVVLNHDRLFTPDKKEEAAIPRKLTGEIDRQFISLVNGTQAELTAEGTGVEPLDARQEQWARLRAILPTQIDLAYVVSPGATDPKLTYATKKRQNVITAAARIGLAEATLVVDAAGSYRGEQKYMVSNRTEQFLVIELPPGARLWTAIVDGQPVKPAPDTATPPNRRIVRIPLVKSAEGELDYEIRLKYGNDVGGRLNLSSLASIEFPLIVPVNIKAEANRVRLFLPEEYSWFNFGGTARTVVDVRDLQAEGQNYATRQLSALVKTLREGDMLAKARATSNLKQLRSSLVESERQSLAGDSAANPNLYNAQREQQAVLDLVDKETKKFDAELLDESKSMATDNREKLNELALRQSNGRAFNLANEGAANFELGTQPNAPAAGDEKDEKWLERNFASNSGKLAPRPNKAGGKDGDKGEGKEGEVQSRVANVRNAPWQPLNTTSGGSKPSQGQGQGGGQGGQAGPQFYGQQQQEFSELQGKNKERIDELVKQQSAVKGQKDVLRSESEVERANRYQERYSREGNRRGGNRGISNDMEYAQQPGQQQVEGNVQLGGIPANPRPGFDDRFANGPNAADGYRLPAGRHGFNLPGGGFGPGVGGPGPGVLVNAPPGNAPGSGQSADFDTLTDLQTSTLGGEYASLEIELPQRGREFLFTAPRGDVEITAQPFDQELITRGGHFGQLALVALAVLCLLWVASRVLPHIGLAWLAGGLIVLALLGLIFNVLPYAALLALAIGVTIAIAALRAARMAAANG